jgi:hypothetical protein
MIHDTVQSTPHAASDTRTWEVLCHLSALLLLIGIPFGNIFGPLIVWLIKRGDSPSVDEHGKESLNFQISLLIYLAVATAVTALLSLILIGLLLWPLLIIAFIIWPVLDLILVIVASIKASNGEFYRYPLTLRLLR